jgi:microcystin-dependent protein
MSEPFLAEVRIFPYNFAPRGWAFCDGQLLAIAQNTALFSLVGTIYGGNGITTFALPNLQGRTPIGQGQGPGLSSYEVGETGGVETVTLTAQELPSHTHSLRAVSGAATTGVPGGTVAPATGGSAVYAPAQNLVAMAPIGGAGAPHPNRQPYTVLNFCIAVQGIFPSRN